jgi:hypothetical protein
MTVERRAGRWFRWILGAEVAFLVGGLQLVRALGAAAPSRVGWIAFVVGLHFVRLAFAWRAASIAIPGALVLAPGVAVRVRPGDGQPCGGDRGGQATDTDCPTGAVMAVGGRIRPTGSAGSDEIRASVPSERDSDERRETR